MALVIIDNVVQGFDSIEDMFIEELVIPEGVIVIGKSAFESCTCLKSVKIPSSVREIGWCAFRNCYSLVSVQLSEGLETIGSYAFYDCCSLSDIVIPTTVREIRHVAFAGCQQLTKIVIPNGIEKISDHAFCYCSSLADVYLPDTIRVIGGYAFKGCTKLVMQLPPQLEEIGDVAFSSNCDEPIIIPASVKRIGSQAHIYLHSKEMSLLCSSMPQLDEHTFNINGWLEYIYAPHIPIEQFTLNNNSIFAIVRGFLKALSDGREMDADVLTKNIEYFREHSVELKKLYLWNEQWLNLVCAHNLIGFEHIPALIDELKGDVSKTAVLLQYGRNAGAEDDYQL